MSVDFYDRHAEEFVGQTVDVDMSEHYRRFLAKVPVGGSILDAGSGSGRDSLAFKRMGYDVEAFDASEKMVEATRRLASVPTEQMAFEMCRLDREFDGIWACASLLHVRRDKLPEVLARLAGGLARSGALYASFKYGSKEREKGGRYFNDLNEFALEDAVSRVPELIVQEVWVTPDKRADRTAELWLNCLLLPS